MRCRYTFAVTSDASLPATIVFKRGLTQYTLKSDQGRFAALIVERPGVKMSNLGQVTPPAPGGIGQFTIPSDPLLPFIQMELRAIRAALALWGVHNIETDRPQIEWSPETDDEKKALQISSFQWGRPPLGTLEPRPVPIDQLVRPFLCCDRFFANEIPLEFFRRGREDLAEECYVEAIYDLYFVLEFLFADGKFTKHAVRDAMLSSAELNRIIAESQRHPMPDIRDQPSDLARFVHRYQNQSAAQVIDTIVDLRGFLHHQSMTRKKNWNPATPDEFKVDAFFLCAMAHSAVLNLTTQLVFLPEEDAKFQATKLSTPDGRKIRLYPLPDPRGAETFDVPPLQPGPDGI